MAPPPNLLKAAKRGKKSNSKDERKQSSDHQPRTAEEASLPDGPCGKVHGKNPKKEKKAGAETEDTEAGAGVVKRGDEKMKRATEDKRFAPARTDPRFRPMRRKEAKVALDTRFSRMLTDPMFASSEAPVDRRGRRRKKGARQNPVLHCYLNQEDEEKKEKEKLIREEGDDELEEEGEQDEEESSSSDDDEDDVVENDDQYSLSSDIAHYLMARHDDTPIIDKETHRLAVANMNWDHIKAVDLYMVMKSCVPKAGRVLSVSIYPTEFGLKCMNIETTQGPSALVGANGDDDGGEYNSNNNEDDDGNDDDGEEDSDLDSETENNKLRTYELNRLRYYHAVVVCDSSATADHLYTTLDGTELMKTANVFDLRFIPDSVEFKHPAHDIATEAPPNYEEPDFETPALQHGKVKLTWDDDEPDRKKILRQKFKGNEFDAIRVYFGSDSESDNDVDDSGDESLPNGVAKRKLTNEERLDRLQPRDKSDEEQTDDQDIKITFNMECEDLSKRILERKSTETKTVWELHQQKMKEKRKARKRSSKDDDDEKEEVVEDSADENDDFFDDEKSDEESKPIKKQKVKARDKGNDKLPKEHFEQEATREELELLVATDQDAANGAKGYNIKRKSKKGKRGKECVEDKLPEIDLSKDPRFQEMLTSHLYALDPTNPQYKRTTTFMRKQAGKKGGHTGKLDSEPPVDESSLGNTMPPDDAFAVKANQKHVGASTEKLQMLSAVKSLKRNLTAFKKASMSDQP